MKYCNKCGKAIADDARYCSFCGAKIFNYSGSADYYEEHGSHQNKDPREHSKVRMGPMIAAIILFGFTAFFVVVSFFVEIPESALLEGWAFFAAGLLSFIMAFTKKGTKYMFNRFPMRKGIFITLFIVIAVVISYAISMGIVYDIQSSTPIS